MDILPKKILSSHYRDLKFRESSYTAHCVLDHLRQFETEDPYPEESLTHHFRQFEMEDPYPEENLTLVVSYELGKKWKNIDCIIVRKMQNEGHFSRVGYLGIWEFIGQDWESFLEEELKLKEQIITIF